MSREIENLKSCQIGVESELKRLKQEKIHLQDANISAKEEVITLRHRVSNVQSAHDRLSGSVTEARSQFSDVQTKNMTISRDLEERTAEYDRIVTEKTVVDALLKLIRTEKSDLVDDKTALLIEQNDLNSRIKALQDANRSMKGDAVQQSIRILAFKDQTSKLFYKNSNHRHTIGILQSDRDKSTTALQKCRTHSGELQLQILELNT